jgi:hypothetical protein
LGATDSYTNVCDIDCGNITFNGLRLEHILPATREYFPPGHRLTPTQNISDYKFSQFKFVWGFIHEYKRIASQGGPMPMWWFIKDDDTYVHIDRLMAFAATLDSSEPVVAGLGVERKETRSKPKVPHLAGGAGWLASAAMAHAMVVEHGDQWLNEQADALRGCGTSGQYDLLLLHNAILRVEGATIVNSVHFQSDAVDNVPACPRDPNLISLQIAHKWEAVTSDPYEASKLTETCFIPSD